MVGFLHKIYQALDDNKQVLVFYTNFSKTFDEASHFELMKKVVNIGVRDCLLEVLAHYLDRDK